LRQLERQGKIYLKVKFKEAKVREVKVTVEMRKK